MILNDPNGIPVKITKDNRMHVIAATEGFMHAMAEIGEAWTVNGAITAADTTDNVIMHFENTSDKTFDCHGVIISSSGAGLVALEYGRTFVSDGGTARSLAQFNTLSGKTQDQTSYIANDITLSGTGTDLICARIAADTQVDILSMTEALQLEPSATISVRFQADAGTPTICIAYICHGSEPWEDV
ncbi:MAG: hypothetical protein V3R78_10165 [Thermodesulfobacteriota bacterium]